MAPPLESTVQVPSNDPKKKESEEKEYGKTQEEPAKPDGKEKPEPEKDEMVRAFNDHLMIVDPFTVRGRYTAKERAGNAR